MGLGLMPSTASSRRVTSARFAYVPKSASSPPQKNGVVAPARAAHCHSASVGRRTSRPVFLDSQRQNASAFSCEMRTAGKFTAPGVPNTGSSFM